MPMTYSVGFGAAAPGQSYPAVYTVGWQATTSFASVTARTGSISLGLPAGLGLLTGTSININDGGGRQLIGLIASYNNFTGATVFTSYHTRGSGSFKGTWNVYLYGVWRSITGPATPSMTWTQLDAWPRGSTDTVTSINGDLTIYGRIFIGFSGSGSIYGTFN
jgi:hypothetical protein